MRRIPDAPGPPNLAGAVPVCKQPGARWDADALEQVVERPKHSEKAKARPEAEEHVDHRRQQERDTEQIAGIGPVSDHSAQKLRKGVYNGGCAEHPTPL